MNTVIADTIKPVKVLDLKKPTFILIEQASAGQIWISKSQEEMLAAVAANNGIAGLPSPGKILPGISIANTSITFTWWQGEMWAMTDNAPSTLHIELGAEMPGGSCDKCSHGAESSEGQ